MKSLLKPHWILFFVILPQLLLAGLFFSSVNIIESLLEPKHLELIKWFGVLLGSGVVIFGLSGLWLMLRRKELHSLWAGLTLIIYYFLFLSFYMRNHDMIPWRIPTWMLSNNDITKYVFTCTMPPMIFGILLITLHFTPEDRDHKVWKNFLSMIGIPAFWYLFFVVVLPLLHSWDSRMDTLMIVLLAVSTIVFLFFLIRAIYIITLRREGFYEKNEVIIKAVFGIALPIAGLIISEIGFYEKNMFGDFSSWKFYSIAFFQGVILCIPSRKSAKVNLLLFVLKAITFTFTFYFFLVFLPFLPLSILAIIAAGLGFLMLTPSVLFIIHIQALYQDFQKLKTTYSPWKLNLILIAGFLVFPAAITLSYLNDRSNLHIALDYVYEPNLKEDKPLDISSVGTVLNHIHAHKESNASFGTNQIPYLTSYYKWLVMDNLTLSDQKLQLMEKIFLGKSETKVVVWDSLRKDDQVKLSSINTRTTYDSTNQCWKTWLDLEIVNNRERQSEYVTGIHLPEGCWISNYYLWVEGKQKFGLLAEKKTAQWIYSQIRQTRRDPGILYYVGANEVMFRVFPFNAKESRLTGIELTHYEPMELNLDGNKITLGEERKEKKTHQGGNIVFLSATTKATLPKVQRTPYLHFILDCSNQSTTSSGSAIKASLVGSTENEAAFQEKLDATTLLIEEFLSRNMISKSGAVISFTDYKSRTFSFDDNWQQKHKESTFSGGFFLERTIRETLVENYLKSFDRYPVFIVISDKIEAAINTKALLSIPYTYPEGPSFYHLSKEGMLNHYSFKQTTYQKPIQMDVREIKIPAVHVWQSENSISYLPIDSEGAIVVKDLSIISPDLPDGPFFQKALHLHALDQKLSLFPHETQNLWLPIIKASFLTKLMTPQTSYIVVENEAQEKALLAKQQQVLNAKNSLDIADQEIQMSEPDIWIVLILLVVFLAWRKKVAMRNEV